MNKKELKTLIDFSFTELQNKASAHNLTSEDELFYWTELIRFCSRESSSIAFEIMENRKENE